MTQAAAPDAWLGRYEPLRTLGEGGSGTVYEARDRTTGERIALKELIRVSAATLRRFKQEFRAVQELHHRNLVRLDALFEDRGKWFIAMELVEGTDLLQHVYAADSALNFHEAQLRDAFLQLAEGLSALHAAGLVHRDLKPSNVRVTHEGRVVLLDFGLAIALDKDTSSTRTVALGTIAYMAPEQAAAKPIGPAADWYAFGVCLYEALTGFLPIDTENALGLLLAKQREIPSRASRHTPIPSDLDDLCAALLSIDPEQRPSGEAVLASLRRGVGAHSRPSSDDWQPATTTSAGASEFEGRERELAALEAAIGHARAGELRVVLVEGESGIGKSSLVEHFLSTRATAADGVMVLRSRCYENELLAYKAFDGAMDTLANALSALQPEPAAEIFSAQAGLVCRLFPALASVKALTQIRLSGLAADPSVQRLEAFAQFARLLGKLSQRQTLVIAIDDLQWADAESFRLLHALLAAPELAHCLILATVRPPAELEGDAIGGVAALSKLEPVSELRLSGLPEPQARALARELMGPLIPDSWLEMIVRESGGHPLFLSVLARFAESQDPNTAAELTLDSAIAARLGGLPRKARRLIEIVAVVAAPLAMQTCGRAAGLEPGELSELVADLCRRKLLRRRGAGEIACFHDRIRHVAVEYLPRVELRELHSRVAAALAAHGGSDPARLARHHAAAGEFEPAYHAYVSAAQRAHSALAFGSAVEAYARALEAAANLTLTAAELSALRIERGHALARSGQSELAAREYLEAAAHAGGEAKTRLRIWAAQHLLQGAHVQEGMAAARALLSELGVALPNSPSLALARVLWDRARAGMSRKQLPSAPGPIALDDRMRLDALWGLAMPLAWIEPLASAAASARHLRLSRALGEPSHFARALAEDAFARAIAEPHDATVDGLLIQARAACATLSDPTLEVVISFREGTVGTIRWDLARARERLEHALAVAAASCPDQPWLVTNVRSALASAWASSGEHARHAAALRAWLVEARERNDRFAITMLEGVGFGVFLHLMPGRPDDARAALTEALAPWPKEPFSFAHFGELTGTLYSELYRGGDGARHWLEHERARHSRAFLLKTDFGLGVLLSYRSYACVASRAQASPSRRKELDAEIRRNLRQMSRTRSPLARYSREWLEAQLTALQGDHEGALGMARRTREDASARGNAWLANSVAYFMGQLEGGDGGRALRQSALDVLATQGWKDPRRAIAMLCPAADCLDR